VQALLNKADDIKQFSERLLNIVQQLAQPDPTARLLPGFTQEGANRAEQFADYMQTFGAQVDSWPDGLSSALAPAMRQGTTAFVTVCIRCVLL
jgi:hypothetical protein